MDFGSVTPRSARRERAVAVRPQRRSSDVSPYFQGRQPTGVVAIWTWKPKDARPIPVRPRARGNESLLGF